MCFVLCFTDNYFFSEQHSSHCTKWDLTEVPKPGMLLEVSHMLAQDDTIGSIWNWPKFNHLRFFRAFYKNLKYGYICKHCALREQVYRHVTSYPFSETDPSETSPISFKTNRQNYSRAQGQTPPCTCQSSLGGAEIQIPL